MTTFSQVVDDLVSELKRPDLRTEITSYLNATIRELHSNRATKLPILYGENRLETTVTTTASPHLWDIPRVQRFQLLEAAYCPELGRYIQAKAPRAIYLESDAPFKNEFWYRTGPQIAFYGHTVGDTLTLSYFEYPRAFIYYAESDRPCVWDPESETFGYHADYDADAAENAAAEELCTCWLIMRWSEEVLKEGVRAKIWRRIGNKERAGVSYSAYEASKDTVQFAEEYIGMQGRVA